MLPLPGLDFVEQMCWQEFLDASTRLLAAFDARLRDMHALALLDVLLLDLLATAAVRKPELADALMQPPDQVALQIRGLQAKGLIGRWPTPYDRRAALVCITPRRPRPGRRRPKDVRRGGSNPLSGSDVCPAADRAGRQPPSNQRAAERVGQSARTQLMALAVGAVAPLDCLGRKVYGPALHGLRSWTSPRECRRACTPARAMTDGGARSPTQRRGL